MSAVVDIVFVCIIALSVYFCAVKGFYRSLVCALGAALALAVALLLCGSLGNALVNSGVGDFVQSSLTEYTEKLSVDGIRGEQGDYIETLVEFADAESEHKDFQAQCNALSDEDNGAVAKAFESTVAPKIKVFFCKCIAFLILFAVARLILKIVEYILDRAVAFPELKHGNRVLGGVVGVSLAFVRVNALCIALKLLLPLVSGFSEKMIPNSALFRFFDGIGFGF